MATVVQQTQNDISTLPQLESFRYENLFNVYTDVNGRYFYNILSKVNFPQNMQPEFYSTYTVPANGMPWTYISYKIYNTILLWWLICAVNGIQNPVFLPQAGTQLKYLNPEYVRTVIAQMNKGVS